MFFGKLFLTVKGAAQWSHVQAVLYNTSCDLLGSVSAPQLF